jgi:hypothetical protein
MCGGEFRRRWHLLPLHSAAALQKRAPRGLRGVPTRPWPRARPDFRTTMHDCAFPYGKGCLASEREGTGAAKGLWNAACSQAASSSVKRMHAPAEQRKFRFPQYPWCYEGCPRTPAPCRATRSCLEGKKHSALPDPVARTESPPARLCMSCATRVGWHLANNNYRDDTGERGSQSQLRANKGASTTSSLRWFDIFRCWSSASATSGCISPRMARSAMATFLCAPLLRACSWWPCTHADGVPVSAELVLALQCTGAQRQRICLRPPSAREHHPMHSCVRFLHTCAIQSDALSAASRSARLSRRWDISCSLSKLRLAGGELKESIPKTAHRVRVIWSTSIASMSGGADGAWILQATDAIHVRAAS